MKNTIALLTLMWSLAEQVHAQEPKNITNREALVATEKLKQLPIEKYLPVSPVKSKPAKSTLTCERAGYRTVTEKRNRAWEFSVDAVRDHKTGEFYVGFPCDYYVKTEAGIAGINFSPEGFSYVLPSWLAKQEAVANHKLAWKAFEDGLTFARLEAAREEAVSVPFPAAIFWCKRRTKTGTVAGPKPVRFRFDGQGADEVGLVKDWRWRNRDRFRWPMEAFGGRVGVFHGEDRALLRSNSSASWFLYTQERVEDNCHPLVPPLLWYEGMR